MPVLIGLLFKLSPALQI